MRLHGGLCSSFIVLDIKIGWIYGFHHFTPVRRSKFWTPTWIFITNLKSASKVFKRAPHPSTVEDRVYISKRRRALDYSCFLFSFSLIIMYVAISQWVKYFPLNILLCNYRSYLLTVMFWNVWLPRVVHSIYVVILYYLRDITVFNLLIYNTADICVLFYHAIFPVVL